MWIAAGRARWPLAGRPGAVLVAGRPRPQAIRDLELEFDAIAPGNPKQIGGPPQHIILEFGDLSVGEYHLPHHLDDAQPALLVDLAHDHTGEMIKVDRIVLGPG